MAVDFRYRELGYLALDVSDIERSTKFATDIFGLDLVGEAADGARFFRAGMGHHDLILAPAAAPAFARSSWKLETDADVDLAFAHYQRLNLAPAWISDRECAGLSLEKAFRVVEPVARTTFEYFSKMSQISSPRSNTLTKFQGGKHYGLAVPNCREMTDYMTENMGFLVSDYVEGWLGSLLRAFPNPNHHSFAPLQFPGGKTGFHHLAFMVQEIDDIGRLFNRVKKHDIKIQFGIGRHPTSGSIHLYLYDDDFFVWEYTLGMEQFPETGAREARRMSSAPENFDLWGAVPDREFAGRNPPFLVSP
ncbi:VOC family protein [Massilia cavernae]|uniref:Bleomycin resistance protein n=1 Tax=Massilia cavernae TaxID=2320864 RepID=A0A418Y4W3_9BURK|nr:VOC family protein [Massilia cavernae]RJG20974.1 bleomycin resistance protein [Massilia cavernae]